MSSQPQDETLPQSDQDLQAALERAERSAGRGAVDAPAQIPGYELIRPLGRGAFGEVWLALAGNTRREVAIKIFTRRSGLDWQLLRREVEKMAAVATERRVVQLLEVGWEGEHPYFVMELLPGGSLAEALDGVRPPVEKSVGYFREVAEALVYLHSKAIIHCDLKPANVLLDGHGGIRLGDFGQARARHERGSVAGTLFYMAPEQATLNARPDVRSDLYSLGAILFALLTGHPPHATSENSRELASSSTVTDRLEKYRRLLQSAESPLQHPDIQRLDKPLQSILRRCLDPDPAERFANAQQVLDAVDARQRIRQQRPLLIFGLLAPLVLWVGTAALGLGAFDATVAGARATLVEQALAAGSATAKVAAAAVDYNLNGVERRVSREASRSRLVELMEKPSSSASQALQDYADELYESYRRRDFFSWVIADHNAVAQARAPFDARVVGSSYGYREWFSARVESLHGDHPVDTSPRTEPGLTLAFRSTAQGEPVLISVAAPILASPSPAPEVLSPAPGALSPAPEVLGVVAATLHLETFHEWLGRAESLRPESCPERMILLLNRGQLVRHPCPSSTAPPLPVSAAEFFDRPSVQELLSSESLTHAEFEDPLNPGTEYLAVAARLQGHPDWTALVLEEKANALAPLRDLARGLRKLAAVGLAVGLLMVLCLYALLFRVIRSPRS